MKILKPLTAIVICELAGIIGGIFTSTAIPVWYAGLIKPAFNPPGWVFGPVWTILYALMGIALYLFWEKRGQAAAKIALGFFGIQLVLNVGWSFLFFGLKSPGSALIEILFLWIAILLTIMYGYRVDKRTIWLLLPYLLWVSFAAVLNYSIWHLN